MNISEQVKKLREHGQMYKHNNRYTVELLNQAADTIESLSAKLQAANMEQPAEDCGGWIPCSAENLPDKEVLCCDNYGEMILGYVFEHETSDTGFSAENNHEYMHDCVKWMEKPKP